jgi:drug/metabolite transporter (DMT)-like permease
MRISTSVWAMLVLLSLLWGGSFFFVAVAVREVPPLTLVSLRVGLGAVALWLVVLASGQPVPRGRAVWAALALMGLLNNAIPFVLFAWAQTRIPSGLASILNATTPIFTALVAGALLADERLTRTKLVGVLLGAAGATLVIGPGVLAGLGSDVVAQGACLAAAISYAFSSVWGRRFRAMGLQPIPTAAGAVTTSAAMLTPVALAVEQPWTHAVPSLDAMGGILGLALLSTTLAYMLFYRIMAAAGTNVMLVTFLIPVSAILLGAIFLGERLAGTDFIGMGLIAFGLAVIDGRLLRRT